MHRLTLTMEGLPFIHDNMAPASQRSGCAAFLRKGTGPGAARKDDFAAARNESFSHASMDYCMWLDADDVLLEEDQRVQSCTG